MQRDMGMIEGLVNGEGSPVHAACWQRIRARLTPDRERVARAIHDANTTGLKGEDVWLARADAAIAAMGEP